MSSSSPPWTCCTGTLSTRQVLQASSPPSFLSLSFVLPFSPSHLSFFLLLLPRPSILLAVSFLGLPPSPNLLFSFPNYSILLFSPSPSFTSYLLFPRHCPLLLLLHSGLNIHRETAVRRGLSGGGNIPREIFEIFKTRSCREILSVIKALKSTHKLDISL